MAIIAVFRGELILHVVRDATEIHSVKKGGVLCIAEDLLSVFVEHLIGIDHAKVVEIIFGFHVAEDHPQKESDDRYVKDFEEHFRGL